MTDTIRDILARYGVNPDRVPAHGEDVTPIAVALEARERDLIAGVGLALGVRIELAEVDDAPRLVPLIAGGGS